MPAAALLHASLRGRSRAQRVAGHGPGGVLIGGDADHKAVGGGEGVWTGWVRANWRRGGFGGAWDCGGEMGGGLVYGGCWVGKDGGVYVDVVYPSRFSVPRFSHIVTVLHEHRRSCSVAHHTALLSPSSTHPSVSPDPLAGIISDGLGCKLQDERRPRDSHTHSTTRLWRFTHKKTTPCVAAAVLRGISFEKANRIR